VCVCLSETDAWRDDSTNSDVMSLNRLNDCNCNCTDHSFPSRSLVVWPGAAHGQGSLRGERRLPSVGSPPRCAERLLLLMWEEGANTDPLEGGGITSYIVPAAPQLIGAMGLPVLEEYLRLRPRQGSPECVLFLRCGPKGRSIWRMMITVSSESLRPGAAVSSRRLRDCGGVMTTHISSHRIEKLICRSPLSLVPPPHLLIRVCVWPVK